MSDVPSILCLTAESDSSAAVADQRRTAAAGGSQIGPREAGLLAASDIAGEHSICAARQLRSASTPPPSLPHCHSSLHTCGITIPLGQNVPDCQ